MGLIRGHIKSRGIEYGMAHIVFEPSPDGLFVKDESTNFISPFIESKKPDCDKWQKDFEILKCKRECYNYAHIGIHDYNEVCLAPPQCDIWSVRRLKDNTVWTVGDRDRRYGKISGFNRICNEKENFGVPYIMALFGERTKVNLSCLEVPEKVKPNNCVCYDEYGNPLYKGEKVYWVDYPENLLYNLPAESGECYAEDVAKSFELNRHYFKYKSNMGTWISSRINEFGEQLNKSVCKIMTVTLKHSCFNGTGYQTTMSDIPICWRDRVNKMIGESYNDMINKLNLNDIEKIEIK